MHFTLKLQKGLLSILSSQSFLIPIWHKQSWKLLCNQVKKWFKLSYLSNVTKFKDIKVSILEENNSVEMVSNQTQAIKWQMPPTRLAYIQVILQSRHQNQIANNGRATYKKLTHGLLQQNWLSWSIKKGQSMWLA